MNRNLLIFNILFLFQFDSAAQEAGARWVIPPILEGFDSFEISPKEDDTRFVVKKGKLEGVCDKNGQVILPIEYTNIELRPGGWMEAGKDGKRLLFNEKGENISRPYEKFVALDGGTALVFKNQRWGVVNQQGEEIVPVAYHRYTANGLRYVFFKENEEKVYLAPPEKVFPNVQRVNDARAGAVLAGHYFIGSGKNCGFLDAKGDTVVPPLYKFDAIHPAGYIKATLDLKTWGVIDQKHRTLYPFKAEKMGVWTNSGLLPVKADKQWGLLRFPKGEVVIPFGAYDFIEVYDAKKDLFLVTKNKLQGLINAQQKVLLPIEYSYISQSDHVTTDLVKNGLHGYWHRPSNRLAEPAWRRIHNLNDSLCILSTDTTWGVVDVKTGRMIIPISKFEIGKDGPYFVSNLKYDPTIPTTDGGRLHGLYDRQGRTVFAPDSVDIVVFPDGTYFTYPHYKKRASNKSEHRKPDGTVIRTLPKTGIFEKYWIRQSTTPEGKYNLSYFSYLDPPGQERYYDSIDKLTEHLRRVKQGDKFGFTDAEGRVVIPVMFNAAEPSQDGYIRVKYEGKWGVLQNPKFDYFAQFEKNRK